jgi:hypothetical protein
MENSNLDNIESGFFDILYSAFLELSIGDTAVLPLKLLSVV